MRKWTNRTVVLLLLIFALSAVAGLIANPRFEYRHYSSTDPLAWELVAGSRRVRFALIRIAKSPPSISQTERLRILGVTFVSFNYEIPPETMCAESAFLSYGPLANFMIHGSSVYQKEMIVPFWTLAIGGMLYPCCWFGYSRHRRHRHANGCAHCHYDLTGNESGICPECGEAVEATA